MINEIITWWQSKNIKTSEELRETLDNFQIVFACNSNRIEGNTLDYHTTRDIFEGNSLMNFNGSAREIFEVQNQKYAFDYILTSFNENNTTLQLYI